MNQLSSITNQSFHSKTYSLPTAFDQVSIKNAKMPIIAGNETPLPHGWTCEKTSNGQIYFINHILKITQWEDPRLTNKLPIYPNEVKSDLKKFIIKTIPLPNGWEETKTANGEIFYINHNNKQTQWEDPRIAIYMQQEYEKYRNNNQIPNGSYPVNNQYLRSNLNLSKSDSNSSISSSSSVSSQPINQPLSSQSLNSLNQNIQPIVYSKSIIKPATSDISSTYSKPNSTAFNEKHISNLKNSLDLLSKQKNSIISQLEDLNKKEINLRCKLSENDLNDVLRMLKNTDNKIASLDQYEKSNVFSQMNTVQTQQNMKNCNINNTVVKIEPDNCKSKSGMNNSNLNSSVLNGSNADSNNEMDSTLILQ